MSIIGVVSEEAREAPRRAKTGGTTTPSPNPLREPPFKKPVTFLPQIWCTCFFFTGSLNLGLVWWSALHEKVRGIKVNCFMRVGQLLPKPKEGDVVLLRQVKVPRITIRWVGRSR